MDWKEVVDHAPRKVAKKAIKFCEKHECKECLIHIYDLEHRTKDEKDFVPCVDNLIYELATNHYMYDSLLI